MVLLGKYFRSHPRIAFPWTYSARTHLMDRENHRLPSKQQWYTILLCSFLRSHPGRIVILIILVSLSQHSKHFHHVVQQQERLYPPFDAAIHGG